MLAGDRWLAIVTLPLAATACVEPAPTDGCSGKAVLTAPGYVEVIPGTSDITVVNGSCSPVSVEAQMLDAAGQPDLQLLTPGVDIPGRSAGLLSVRFEPAQAGWYWARLQMKAEVGDPVTTVIRGHYSIPTLTMSPTVVKIVEDVGSLTVANCGPQTAQLLSAEANSDVTVENLFPVWLLPGLEEDLLVRTYGASDDVEVIEAHGAPMAKVFVSSLACDESDDDLDGWSVCAGDCDDADAALRPDQPEVAGDFLDNDCDGGVDFSGGCDGWFAGLVAAGDVDGDGVTEEAGDCDDLTGWAGPGVPEMCDDGLDNDCDGDIDEGCT